MRCLIFLILFSAGWSWAQDQNDLFDQAIAAYQKQDFEAAKQHLDTLNTSVPDNPQVLFNLGLAEYQLGRVGKALGLWRKARSMDPSLQSAQQAIEFTEEQIFPSKGSLPFYQAIWSTLRMVPLFLWAGICLICFAALGWGAVECSVRRQIPFLHWPNPLLALIPIFTFSAIYCAIETSIRSQQKATVIVAELQTRVTPSENAPTLSPVSEGEVVEVKKTMGPWSQIIPQDGRPGWVSTEHLIYFKEI